MKTEAIEITLKCYNNLAACILQGQNRTESDFLRAVEYCDKVISKLLEHVSSCDKLPLVGTLPRFFNAVK